jgi:hypothetical protein
LCIAAESLLGLELGPDADSFGAAMRSALASLGQRARFGVSTPDWLPVPHNLRMRRAMQPIDAVVARAIAQQRGPLKIAAICCLCCCTLLSQCRDSA